mmetsp:Transcript_11929/g.27667  ORF Transcript_11929/g.27667 Transcript_11929/m.27667 type:complete len:335 (-) Transcript_11929:130-1134(-)
MAKAIVGLVLMASPLALGLLTAPIPMRSPTLGSVTDPGVMRTCSTQATWVGLRYRRGMGSVGGLVMAKKDFDKKYDGSFRDFRTSGSMPSIPGISEQYQVAQTFVREKQGAKDEEGGDFEARGLTEAQEALERERLEGLSGYEELKGELLFDTAYIGALGLAAAMAFLGYNTVQSYALGAAGSFGYSFLLTKTADRMGEQPGQGKGADLTTPLRFGILFFLIVCCAKNRETLEILPVLFGFFVPYKLASLRPALVSVPPLGDYQVRIFRDGLWGKEPYKIEYGSKVVGKSRKRASSSLSSADGAKTQGSSAPLGKRNIASIEDQYEALKKGTMD